MDSDVAAFARQLRQDGIDATHAEAERILAKAREQAAEILRAAAAAAEEAGANARGGIERERQRFAVEVRLAARDTMLLTRQQIERVVLRLLRAKVADALATEEVVRAAVLEVIRNAAPGSAWELAHGPAIGKALVAAAIDDLLKGREATVAVVEEFGRSGLEFRAAGGAEVLELTEESVAEVFRRLLSPELSRLIDSLPG